MESKLKLRGHFGARALLLLFLYVALITPMKVPRVMKRTLEVSPLSKNLTPTVPLVLLKVIFIPAMK
jgi:hypothetical protein